MSDPASILLKGAKAIGAFIHELPQTAERMCRRGEVPGAFKRGKRWRLDINEYEAAKGRQKPNAADQSPNVSQLHRI